MLAGMRMWIAIAVMLVGCEKKPSKPTPAQGSGSAGVVAGDAAPADSAPVVVAGDATPAIDAGPPPLDTEHLLDTETIGPLRLGLDDRAVVKILGDTKKKTFPQEEGATGELVSDWTWPSGVTLGMASDKRSGPFHVRSIALSAPSTYKTSRGIGIASTLAELSAQYPRNTEEGSEDDNQFLVGSVYGGELFTLVDGKVATIFLGAMAF